MFLVNEDLPISLPPTTTISQGSSSGSFGTIALNTTSTSSTSTTTTTGCIRIRRKAATTGKPGKKTSSPGNRLPPSKWLLAIMVWIAFVL